MIEAWEDTVFPVLSRCESEELKSEPEALGGEWGGGQVSQVFRILGSLAKYQIILAKYQAILTKYLAILAKYQAILAKYQAVQAKYSEIRVKYWKILAMNQGPAP